MSDLPTTPGPYWWREKEGDEWELVFVREDSTVPGYEFTVLFPKTGMEIDLPHMQGQWAKAHSPDELATLRAKAEAYDKGVEMWVVYSDKGFPITCSKNGESRAWAKLIKSYGNDLDWYTDEDAKLAGYTCRKVRVCEVVG